MRRLRRTNLNGGPPGTRGSLVLVPALLVALLAATGCGRRSAPATGPAEDLQLRIGFDPTDLDARVRPQDDFFRFANGHWLDATQIPPDLPGYGQIQLLHDKTEQQLRTLVEGEQAAKEAAPGSGARKVADLYASFMDEARAEQLGMAPLQRDIARVDALRTHEDVLAYVGESTAQGVDSPLRCYVDTSTADPDRNLLYLWQGGLGLPDRDYYLLDTDRLARIREEYLAHIARLFDAAGWPDGAGAARVIFGIEKALAERQWSRVQNRDRERIYKSRYTPATATQLAPDLNLPLILAQTGFGKPAEFVIAQTDYFSALGGIVRGAPVANWQQYFRLRLLEAYAPYLTAALANEDFAFRGHTLRGEEEIRARWKRGVATVDESVGDPLGQAYVARYFPQQAKVRIDALVRDVIAAYRQAINDAGWMATSTKSEALAKLAKVDAKVGYPVKWQDYGRLTIDRGDLVGNIHRARSFAHTLEVEKLAKPVDHEEWDTTPQTVNAFYEPGRNEIVFPAAILQAPFFDAGGDDAANYGGIGAVIGHEISHGFDDQGRKLDATGRLRDWWTPEDAGRYRREISRLVTQYGAFRPLPDVAINGELTLGENIADLAGLEIAYRAYRLSLHGREPPVVAGYTGDQRFFIAFGVIWRGKNRDEALREQLLSNPHSPPEYRVLGVLPNMPQFVAAFNVRPGDRMFLPAAERVRIW